LTKHHALARALELGERSQDAEKAEAKAYESFDQEVVP
jgi:hypothetical protein